MALLPILQYPDPRLHKVAGPVAAVDERVRAIVDDMLATMYDANGIGLAATQVDVHERIVVIDVSEERDQPLALVNARILESSGEQVYQEGCLSFPGIFADVTRAQRVRVAYQDVDGTAIEREFEGPLAVCVQHEMDHLQGKVFVDHLSALKRSLLLKRLEKRRRQSA